MNHVPFGCAGSRRVSCSSNLSLVMRRQAEELNNWAGGSPSLSLLPKKEQLVMGFIFLDSRPFAGRGRFSSELLFVFPSLGG